MDLFGHEHDQRVGVQCKQKDGRLWSKVTEAELEAEVEAARRFEPKLARFILATTAPRDAALQRKANELSEQPRPRPLFRVEVWAWEDIWHELYRRYDLLLRIAQVYWPLRTRLPPRPPSLADLVRDARPYLEYIAPQCQLLPLIGLDPKGKDNPLTLDVVYTALDTKSVERAEAPSPPPDQEAKSLSALEAVARHACLVLKGDPGSGKSTFISHFSLCLAKHHLDPKGQWLERLESWPKDASPIPLTIVLRDFVRAQPEKLPHPCPNCLWEFFLETLTDARLAACGDPLETALNLGHAIVFLDGLDEVPTDTQRALVRACTLKSAERFRHARVVLTCRTIPYQAMRFDALPDFELAPFDDDKIGRFIAAWYTAHIPKPFSREVAEERRAALQQAVQRPELRRLAGNPMLLTDMALLHTHRGRLPDDRAKLYKEVIELLLLRWEETKASGGGLQDLLREAQRDDNDLLRISLAKVSQFDDGPDLIARVRHLLKQLLAAEALSPFERMQAGMTLGLLGDDRPGVGVRPRAGQTAVPDLLWTDLIEPGEFVMGGNADFEGKCRFTHRLEHPLRVAVYPVTVAQFASFTQDGGYERQELRTRAGCKWREAAQRNRPDGCELAFQTPNHPRVGVTWYEAFAFCMWLNVAFGPEDLRLPVGWQARLPTEAEWERAARHTDGRYFPWGPADTANPAERCNCRETKLRQTTTAGLFPSGRAMCGAHDLAGNVWEWCLTKWRSDYRGYETQADQRLEGDDARVLRGGAWSSGADYARCAYRIWSEPDDRDGNIGFRVVASPFFALNSEPSELCSGG